MAANIILFVLAATVQTQAPRTDGARVSSSAGVTIVAGEVVQFSPKPDSKPDRQKQNFQHSSNKGRTLIEFY